MKTKWFLALLMMAALLVGVFPLGEVFAHNNTGANGLTSAAPGAFIKSSPASAATGIAFTPTLSWEISSGAIGYEYCFDTTNDSACSGPWISTGTNTSVTLSGLGASTTYYWQVRAVTSGGTTYANDLPYPPPESTGVWWNFTTLVAPPGVFAKIAPVNAATSIAINPTLSWGASSGAASYEYCYDTTHDNICGGTWINTGTNTSAALTGLSTNTTYYWQVRAINLTGTTYANDLPYPPPGSVGTWWSFTTIIIPPGAFSKNAPVNSATGIIINPTLSWGTSSAAASYEYCIDTTNDSACNATWISTGANASVALSGLSYNTSYYWQVRAVNSSGTTYANNTLPYPPPGSTGIWWSFTTIILPPAPFAKSSPVNAVTAIAINPTLSWEASSRAASYEYCIDTTNDSACGGTWISTGTNTSVALSALSYNTTYYWQIRAVNPGGITYANNTLPYPPPPGSTGIWWSFTTVDLPPASFSKSSPANSATGVTATNLTFSWETSNRATSYEYCYDTTNDEACNGTWINAGTNTSVTPMGLAGYTTYYWQVRAVNSGGTTYANDTLPYPAPGSNGIWWKFTTGWSMFRVYLPGLIR
jgi:hypothetical protein